MWKRMPIGCKVLLGLVGLALVMPLLCITCFYVSYPEHLKDIEESASPPLTFSESDLVGIWEAKDYPCGQCIDRLILRANGTFKQIYRDTERGYLYETPWNKWWVERFPDGRVYLHLEGARYYPDGIEEAENPEAFGRDIYHDPFDPEEGFGMVEMVGKLVLNVRVLRSGELVLVHMWPSSESPTWEAFHRVEGSPPEGAEVP